MTVPTPEDVKAVLSTPAPTELEQAAAKEFGPPPPPPEAAEPDWTRKCIVCGATPILPLTGMCGPCTFGEADTAGGNW